MQKPDILIRTKLRLPSIRPGLVSRPRLQEQFAHGLRGSLTLVAAPAGFGKTTLVTTCIAECGMRSAWLSLDKNDNQPGQFLTYLAAALQAADPRIGAEAALMMTGPQHARTEVVLTSLINDLDGAGSELALVLDDYHVIHSGDVHAAMLFLLEHLPNSLHLVIATRADPPLPLARLRARRQMLELRTTDLRFTEQETCQFLNEVMGLQLDDSLVAMLEARTEGWIAGLQMAALSMKNRTDIGGFIEGFSGTNRYILDYLLEEVLARQSSEIQDFLLNTSILERLCAPLCDALSDGCLPGWSSQILKTLERENLFLVALDDDGVGAGAVWFRYHHLFADLLRARLKEACPGDIAVLHIRASQWLEQNGYAGEAIRHLITAQETARAADLMERWGPDYWLNNSPAIVQMAECLPRETLLDHPKLGIYLAWLLICQSRIEYAISIMKDLALHLAHTDTHPKYRWVQTVILCALAFLHPQASSTSAPQLPDERKLDEIPEDEPILRDAAGVLYGMALARRGELERAVTVSLRYIQAESQRVKTGERCSVPSHVAFLARIYLILGHLRAAVAVCHQYIGQVNDCGNRFINSPGSMETVLGEVFYEWNRLDEAEAYLRSGLRANEPWRNIMTEGFGALALVHILQAKGKFEAASQLFQEFESRVRHSSRPREFDEELRTLGARLMLAAGDLQSAGRWADQLSQSEDYQRSPEQYQLTLALIRLAQERCVEVEEVLATEPYLLVSRNHIVRQIETHLLLALAASGQGHLLAAFEHTAAGLALAEPEGYLRVFINMGEPFKDLLAAYLRSADPALKPYAQKVLEAFSPRDTARTAEALTSRELEVLRLMAAGKTNPEVARQLVVSPGTIKAHAASIYRKLDAANRTEAIALARQMGLLP